MVNVGYCIDGKHGMIRNVIPILNTKTEHLCFTQVNGEEQYAIKKENIEYVILSDIDCVNGKIVFDKDGVTDNPVTFAEKFKEVFGFEPDKYKSMCDMVDCDCRGVCQGCPYRDWDWDEPYVKEEVECGCKGEY